MITAGNTLVILWQVSGLVAFFAGTIQFWCDGKERRRMIVMFVSSIAFFIVATIPAYPLFKAALPHNNMYAITGTK